MTQAWPVEAAAFLILFARLGAVLMLLPVFGDEAVPGRVRLLVSLGMTAALWGLLSPRVLPLAAGGDDALATLVVTELLVGLMLGALVRIVFMAAATAGSIVSLQIGLTSALVADPAQGGMASALSKFVSVAAAVVCMAFLVHHLWIGALVRSYDAFPVGGLPDAGDAARMAVETVGRSLRMAVGLAAPMIVYGIVFNVGLGLAARLAPAMQVFFVAQPLNLTLGVALFASLSGAMLIAFANGFAAWTNSIGAMG